MEVPLEIIKLEILPRVPAKSLVRFKCVCKDWLSFLSTQDFAKLHLLESRKHQKLLLFDPPSRTFRTLDCEAPNHLSTTFRCVPFEADHNVLYLASLDGLILLGIKNTRKLMLWNPLTGAYKKLSNYRYYCSDDAYSDTIGLYLDHSTNDYKILHVNRRHSGAFIRAYIYSLKLDRWRRIKFLENGQRISTSRWSKVILSNKSLYFIAVDEYIGGERFVICFDVNSEKFREIKFPHNNDVPSDADDCWWNLVDVKDCIHLFYGYEMNRDRVLGEIELWRMEGEEWKNVAVFHDIHDTPIWFEWYPIYIMKNENWVVIGYSRTVIYRIDFKTKNRVRLYYGSCFTSIEQALFIESFVSLIP